MKVKSYKFKDVCLGTQWFDKTLNHWMYDDYKNNPDWFDGWMSMDCSLYNEEENCLYLGIASFNSNNITKKFNLNTKKFIDINYSKISDPYDAKFHRSLVKWRKDGCIYAAIALFHCVDKQWLAPGGAIVKYDPKEEKFEKIKIPVPHAYIQSMDLDQDRGLLYCQCFPPEYLVTYNLNTGKVNNLGLIGTGIEGMAQGENIILDDQNNLWGAWAITRAWQPNSGPDYIRLFKVPAGGKKILFLETGLPKIDGSNGYEKIEGLFNFGDGYIYASGGNGSLYKLDTDKRCVEYLFTPIKDRPSRLASMALGPDGYAYGVTGRVGKCEVLRFDFKKKEYKLLGTVVDEDNNYCYQVHHLSITNKGIIYACENDNPYRSGYLWEINLN